jgi:hypothetical protein
MESRAKVIPWSSKSVTKEKLSSPSGIETVNTPIDGDSPFEPLSGVVLRIPDDQLEALGTLFSASPLRKSMTFEGYLFVKGYGDTSD